MIPRRKCLICALPKRANPGLNGPRYTRSKKTVSVDIQGLAKEWSLGWANPASSLPLAAGRGFTQPRAHLLAHLCISKRVAKSGPFEVAARNPITFKASQRISRVESSNHELSKTLKLDIHELTASSTDKFHKE